MVWFVFLLIMKLSPWVKILELSIKIIMNKSPVHKKPGGGTYWNYL